MYVHTYVCTDGWTFKTGLYKSSTLKSGPKNRNVCINYQATDRQNRNAPLAVDQQGTSVLDVIPHHLNTGMCDNRCHHDSQGPVNSLFATIA